MKQKRPLTRATNEVVFPRALAAAQSEYYDHLFSYMSRVSFIANRKGKPAEPEYIVISSDSEQDS